MNTTRHRSRRAVLLAFLFAGAVLLASCSQQSERVIPTNQPTNRPAEETTSDAVCAAHDAPKGQCFICDPSLRDEGRLWCSEHDRYEDRCWECHPELEDRDRLWCAEHSLYEDECFLCHPELLEEQPDSPEGATDDAVVGSVLMCKEHGVPERECGICHPDLLTQNAAGQGLKVRLPSHDSAANAGVVVQTPGAQSMEHAVECFAELTFNQNKLARITPLVSGVVKSVEVDFGSRVDEGDLLARLTSVEIGEAQSAYLTAIAVDTLRDRTLERERSLLAQRISSEKEFQEAEAAHGASMAAVRQTRQRLIVLGFDEQQILALAEQQGAPGVLDIRAPFAGEIVERTAVQGAMVEMGESLFTLADVTVLWAMLNIPESELPSARIGQSVKLTVESLPGQSFDGTLTWLSASVDARTRMARGRAEVSNADGRLKAQMFAKARIITSNSSHAVVVPTSAVQSVSGTPVVFIPAGEDLFEARPVTLGAKHNGHIEITAGLRSDEAVVVAGSFALKSQFLISRLGAGCVDE